jgi:hypothetical protein
MGVRAKARFVVCDESPKCAIADEAPKTSEYYTNNYNEFVLFHIFERVDC